MVTDSFGFLRNQWKLEFEGGCVEPVPEYQQRLASVGQLVNQDGFIYPPETVRMTADPMTMQPLKEIPKTRRPALLHQLPVSHTLSLSGVSSIDGLRAGPGAFLIHLLAYLFGTRLQFYDWLFDGRIPITVGHNHNIVFTEETAQDFLSQSYKTYQGWPSKERHLVTNLLYMHSRAPSYEWDWERFVIVYMVLDACLSVAESRQYVVSRTPHAERIRKLCDKFNIPCDDQHVSKIVHLRNELFHEALWDGSHPCTSVSDEAFFAPYNLRRLNQRLVPALLGYQTSYVRTPWWFMGTCSFDKAAAP